MVKNKLKKFSQINAFANVVQPDAKYPVSDFPLKGYWGRDFFGNDLPLVLEIGCGKGEYSLGLARAYPGCNVVGIDIKGDRIWRGAREALEEGLHNVAFLRIQAERVGYFFGPDEVSGIWITFPDPQPRESRKKKRLTSPHFLERYAGILKPGSPIHLKTDNPGLYHYTLDVIREHSHQLLFATDNLYREHKLEEPLLTRIQTYYEKKFLELEMPIHYLSFQLGG